MATHLWRRQSGYMFQRRVPLSLVPEYGTVIRVTIGKRSAGEARQVARKMSVALDAAWSRDVNTEPRRDDAEVEFDLDDIKAQQAAALGAGQVNPVPRPSKADLMKRLDEIKFEQLGAIIHVLSDSVTTIREDRDAIRAENAKLQGEQETLRKQNKNLVSAVEAVSKGMPKPEELPLLSVAAADVVKDRADALGEKSGYPNKLRNVTRAWILVFGDREVDEYKPSQIQGFANKLQFLPRNWAVTPRYKDMSYDEVIADIDRAEERAIASKVELPKRFSQTNIKEYTRQIAYIFNAIRADHPNRVHDFQRAPLTMPREARAPTARGAIPVEGLNAWFKVAAKKRRHEDKYLPLLGFLTGARLSELVYLKAKDVQQLHGQLCFNLLDDKQGSLAKDRPLKTGVSRRLIVLHQIISDTDFITYVDGLDLDAWIFPRLHRVAKPHRTASQRMIRQMQDVGIHEPYSTVFHSLRHGVKDWHYDAKVEDRTSRLQVGHAFKDVDQSYGSKRLRDIEFDRLATLPFPERLDLSPYLQPLDEHGFRT